MISFQCPTCGQPIKAKDNAAGKTGKCKCGELLRIPNAKTDYSDEVVNESKDNSAEHASNDNIESAVASSFTHKMSDSVSGKGLASRRTIIICIVLAALAGLGSATALLLYWKGISPADNEHVLQNDENNKQLMQLRTTTLQGGAWLTRKNGNSEIIRGLDIYVISPKVEKRYLVDTLIKIKISAQHHADTWREGSGGYLNPPQELMQSIARQALTIGNTAISYEQIPDRELVDLESVYRLIVKLDALRELPEKWVASPELNRAFRIRDLLGLSGSLMQGIPESAMICKAKTDIDGKYYTKEVTEGDYCLVAFRAFSILVL